MSETSELMVEGAPASPALALSDAKRRPRLGFLGVGWIGRHRMEAIAADGAAEVAALCDAGPEALGAAAAAHPRAARASSFDALLDDDLDGIVIATPSALHAQQAEAALARGLAVFCQKPLGRTVVENTRVIDAARKAGLLLAVDLSYRHTAAMRRVRELVAGGDIGEVYAVDLVFHNAYGPDKPWFRDPQRSGGGCVIDLGIHLVDLALWTLGFPRVLEVQSTLWAQGRRVGPRPSVVEDHAIAQFELGGGAVARLACSWNLHAGCDAVIEATFHGTRGGARLRNLRGSFYDFVAERLDGTRATLLAEPPDDWGGRAAVDWARRVAAGAGFDPEVARVAEVAAVLDAIYGR
ncbi:Gfo/Idh/MocA family protein [Variovorax sp. DT-64]|uniref:Gfo/Idh/MocA family protein n=1 Tax=Variovorax sp. DT-64 TaxID=3396160 RepID=UPI003F1A44F2